MQLEVILIWNIQNRREAYLSVQKEQTIPVDVRSNIYQSITTITVHHRSLFEKVVVSSSSIALRKTDAPCNWNITGRLVEEALRENFEGITFENTPIDISV